MAQKTVRFTVVGRDDAEIRLAAVDRIRSYLGGAVVDPEELVFDVSEIGDGDAEVWVAEVEWNA